MRPTKAARAGAAIGGSVVILQSCSGGATLPACTARRTAGLTPSHAIRSSRTLGTIAMSTMTAENLATIRLFRELSADPGAQERPDHLRPREAEPHRGQSGLQGLWHDGARAEIRHLRNGDRQLSAGQGLRQAAYAYSSHHDGPLPAWHHAV